MSELDTLKEITRVRSELEKVSNLICPFFYDLIHIDEDQVRANRIYAHLDLAEESADRALLLLGGGRSE